jgi:hypothetical protein
MKNENLRIALRAEARKVLDTENLADFGGYSAKWCALSMPTNCLINPAVTVPARKVIRKIARQLIDPADITASMGGTNCTSYATAERHHIADLCNQSRMRGWLATDPTN